MPRAAQRPACQPVWLSRCASPPPRAWLNTWPPPKPPTSPPLAIQVQPMLEPLAAMRAALDSHEALVARVGVGDKCTP